MTPTELPLLNLFNRLRQRHNFSLGIEDYMLAVRALQAGFGIGDVQALEALCCTLWAKSDEESRRLRRVLREMLMLSDDRSDRFSSSDLLRFSQGKPETLVSQDPSLDLSNSTDSSKQPKPEEPLTKASTIDLSPPVTILEPTAESLPKIDEPVQVVQAIRHYQSSSSEINYPRSGSLTEYFPVTRRQMKQNWRQLRRLVREGPPQDLDLPAVAKLSREGILLEPVLVPRRSNRAEIALLIDQGGSMVPFHSLSRQLIETAERGGRLKQTSVYYFHNYPDHYLYTDPARLKARSISDVLEEIGEKTAVFVVSDAGAARGTYDPDRLEYTQEFLSQLGQSVRYYVWLNPMPSDRWLHTTAGEIARLVPMLEMSREGLNTAIDILRGRYVPWEKMYSWML